MPFVFYHDYLVNAEFSQVSLVLLRTWTTQSVQDGPKNIKLYQNTQVSTSMQCLHLWWQYHTLKIRFHQREIWRTIHNQTSWRCHIFLQDIVNFASIGTYPCPTIYWLIYRVSLLWFAHWLLLEAILTCEQIMSNVIGRYFSYAATVWCGWYISTLVFPLYIWFIFSFLRVLESFFSFSE